MRGANIDFGELAGASRRMQSKQFVSELHERGFARDEAIEMLCLVFCIPWVHARLFVASHPVWAAGWASKVSDGVTTPAGFYGGRALPSRGMRWPGSVDGAAWEA